MTTMMMMMMKHALRFVMKWLLDIQTVSKRTNEALLAYVYIGCAYIHHHVNKKW